MILYASLQVGDALSPSDFGRVGRERPADNPSYPIPEETALSLLALMTASGEGKWANASCASYPTHDLLAEGRARGPAERRPLPRGP